MRNHIITTVLLAGISCKIYAPERFIERLSETAPVAETGALAHEGATPAEQAAQAKAAEEASMATKKLLINQHQKRQN